MKKIVIDIETVGLPWEDWDEKTQEYLIGRGGQDSDEESVRDRLGLSGPTGKIITIGMMNPDTRRGGIYFEKPVDGESIDDFEEAGVIFRGGSEEELLQMFWQDIEKYDTWVTYNGRTFDIPFLMQRSFIRGVQPTKNLDSARYRVRPHCDLMDILSFFGATRPFSLSFWCRILGIEDPKREGIDGAAVGELYREGRILDIARYCLRDLIATTELFRVVERRYLSLRSDW